MKRLRILVWLALSTAFFTSFAADLEFVGATATDLESRAFVGGLDTNVPIHCITWHLTLSKTEAPSGNFQLTARYGLQGKTDPNQLETGPTVKLAGQWQTLKGSQANPNATVFRLKSNSSDRALSLVRIGDNLLHFLDHDKNLKIGNPGWSFTLNRKNPKN